DLSRHHGPMNRLIGSPVSGAQEFWRFVEESSDLLQVAFANRRRDRFSLRRGAVQAGELALQQLLHLSIPAVAGALEGIRESKGICAVVKQVCRDINMVLSHGE